MKQTSLKKNIMKILFLLAFVSLSTACSNNNIFLKQSSDLSSDLSSQIPLNNNTTEPQKQSVAYPSYARIKNSTIQYIETELLVNTQADQKNCLIQSISKPSGTQEQLCLDIPDLCWSNNIALVNRDHDFTCAQTYRALEIAKTKTNQHCFEKVESLTSTEISHVANPLIYNISLNDNDANLMINLSEAGLESLAQNQITTLSALSLIKLDSSCRCSYSFGNADSAMHYEYPALPEHCRTHFPDSY